MSGSHFPPKVIVAARLRENKYGRRTAEKMRSAVLLFCVVLRVIRYYLRITVINRSKTDRGDMRFFPISSRSARFRLEYTFTISKETVWL